MNEDAKGPITGSVLALERMICDCPAFQTRVAASTPIEASEHFRLFTWEDDPADIQAARPFGAAWPGDVFDLVQVAGGASIDMTAAAQTVLLLTDADRYPADRRASGLDFAGFVDEILLWLKENANQQGTSGVYLSIKRLTFLQVPAHSPTKDEATEGSYWHAAILVESN